MLWVCCKPGPGSELAAGLVLLAGEPSTHLCVPGGHILLGHCGYSRQKEWLSTCWACVKGLFEIRAHTCATSTKMTTGKVEAGLALHTLKELGAQPPGQQVALGPGKSRLSPEFHDPCNLEKPTVWRGRLCHCHLQRLATLYLFLRGQFQLT